MATKGTTIRTSVRSHWMQTTEIRDECSQMREYCKRMLQILKDSEDID
ncbi:hypothetical protein WN51_07333 [Melipona quadrifasciata]|uniref:Uncharacterized protein n=1 Tax=Melipona quadrifasciata TaxID=166423 RepID=A0A0M8ZP37_9HYME|nr:hypothetical protein WN51_07333 [Melipona quadrifasciata]